MNRNIPLAVMIAGFAFISSALYGQVPKLINYQGRVAVGAVNFDGPGQFKFALVNANGTTTYWSNDGTGLAANSQPTAAVALTVTKGLYSVLLGDSTLPNMTVIPASVFTNADVRLRVWFNDGTNGSQLLAPDQRLAPTAYLSDGAVTSSKLANGAIGSAQLAPNAVTATNLAPNAVAFNNLFAGSAPTGGQVLSFNGTGLSWTTPTTGGLSAVTHDATLSGVGTGASPLGIAFPLTLSGTTNASNDYLLTISNGSATGVGLLAAGATGVLGITTTASGSAPFGVEGSDVSQIGTNGVGVFGTSVHGTGIVGASIFGKAGQFNGDVGIAGKISFGTAIRSMLSLYDDGTYKYNIGVQNGTFYERAGAGGSFGWYSGGEFDPNYLNNGGGTTLMKLEGTGDLTVGNTVTAYQVTGTSSGFGSAVTGIGNFGTGVYGNATNGKGVYGRTVSAGPQWAGVWGENTAVGGTGIVAKATGSGSTGIYAYGTSYAGYFDGTVLVKVLTITGGSDLAEPFKVSGGEIPKGSVVVIDEENPGHLKMSTRACDTRVAGIVSGAEGVNPGITLHQEGVLEGGQNVALSGRVYVLADATDGAIKPGDLLTTSDTPGHAMKVTDYAKAQGAILGKAMSSLNEGAGMVLVLVTLQ